MPELRQDSTAVSTMAFITCAVQPKPMAASALEYGVSIAGEFQGTSVTTSRIDPT
ncbi:hypothetical protein D3C80_1684560 [compost metagenome]